MESCVETSHNVGGHGHVGVRECQISLPLTVGFIQSLLASRLNGRIFMKLFIFRLQSTHNCLRR